MATKVHDDVEVMQRENVFVDKWQHQRSMSLDANVDRKIRNPLKGIPLPQLMENVEKFARDENLLEIMDLLKKGARVAQSPDNFEEVDSLDQVELAALIQERDHKWKNPMALYATIALSSIGAAVQGWDQTGSNGANLSFPADLGIGEGGNPNSPNANRDNWLVGLVNAAPYISCAFMGCWLSDPFNRLFGRRGAIFISAIILLITPIGGAVSQTWEQLFVSRLLLGLGMGLKAATVSIFAAECAPASIRGALVMSWQMWTAFGIFLGLCANLAVMHAGPITWRLQIGSAIIPTIPLLLGIYFCPESPRWYMKKGRYLKAYRSLQRLRFTSLQAARDLYYIHCLLEVEKTVIGENSWITRLRELFTVPRIRRATVAATVVMSSQQFCGINIIAFYSSTLFVEAGASVRGALLSSLGFGLLNFIFAFPALWTIDSFGRRSLLLFTFPQMAWTTLAAGLSFYVPEGSRGHMGLILLFVYIFASFYSFGEGPVPYVYGAEVFPLSHRELGLGWASANTFFWASVLSLVFPRLLAAFGPTGAFGFFAGLNVLSFCLIFCLVPETKQRTLEELDYVFAIPTRTFISYQLNTTVPWFFRRYLLCDKRAKLSPLMQPDHDGFESSST